MPPRSSISTALCCLPLEWGGGSTGRQGTSVLGAQRQLMMSAARLLVCEALLR